MNEKQEIFGRKIVVKFDGTDEVIDGVILKGEAINIDEGYIFTISGRPNWTKIWREKEEALRQVASMEYKNENISEALGELRNEIRSTYAENDSLTKENEQLKKELEYANNDISKLNKLTKHLVSKYNDIFYEKKNFEEDVNVLKTRNEALHEENKINAHNFNELSTLYEKLQVKYDELQKETSIKQEVNQGLYKEFEQNYKEQQERLKVKYNEVLSARKDAINLISSLSQNPVQDLTQPQTVLTWVNTDWDEISKFLEGNSEENSDDVEPSDEYRDAFFELFTIVKHEEGMFQAWVDNIASAYIDGEKWYKDSNGLKSKQLRKKDKAVIANLAAEHFMGLMINAIA